MADLESLIPPAQGWRVTGPSSRGIKNAIARQGRAQLLAEAAQLTPDYAKLMDTVSKYDLDPASAAVVQSEIKSAMSDYLNKYYENPFYAFSREGKDKVKGLQYYVNNPKLNYAQNAFKLSQEEYKKESEKGTLPYYNYDSGKIKALNVKTGAVEDVSAFLFNPEEYTPLTGTQQYNYVTSNRGFINQEKPFAMNMAKMEDVRNSVNNFLETKGYVKGESIGDLYNVTTKDNRASVAKKANLLINGIGLSAQEKNTIYGAYVTKAINEGRKPDSNEADQYFLNFIKNIAESQYVQEQGVGVSSKLQAAKEMQGLTPISHFELQATGGLGRPSQYLNLGTTGKESFVPYHQVDPSTILDKSRTSVKVAENESPIAKRNFNDLYATQAIGAQNMYIPVLDGPNAGKLVKIPPAMQNLFNEIVAKPDFLGSSLISDFGKGYKEVVGARENTQAPTSAAVILKGQFQGDRTSDEYRQVYDFLTSIGYSPKQVNDATIAELKLHSASGSTESESFWRTGLPTQKNDVWEFPIFGEYTDPKLFNKISGIQAGYESRINDVYNPTGPVNTNEFVEANRRRFSTLEDLNQN